MNKINIVYYTFTGNTLRMVKAFEKGLQEANRKWCASSKSRRIQR